MCKIPFCYIIKIKSLTNPLKKCWTFKRWILLSIFVLLFSFYGNPLYFPIFSIFLSCFFFRFFSLVHCTFQGGYLDGLRSHLGGLTQRVKSWYWGRPLVSAIVFFIKIPKTKKKSQKILNSTQIKPQKNWNS